MLSIPKKIWIAFLPVFGIVLAIVLFVFQARLNLLSLSGNYVAINTILAVILAFGATFAILATAVFLAKLSTRVLRNLLIGLTIYTLNQTAIQSRSTVEAIGIGSREGSIVIRLNLGTQTTDLLGIKFEILNSASKEKLGTLEVIEIEDTSCLCSVFDRINVEFWESLEERMRRDPSPPSGITISREFPDGLLEFMQDLVRNWRR